MDYSSWTDMLTVSLNNIVSLDKRFLSRKSVLRIACEEVLGTFSDPTDLHVDVGDTYF